MNSNYGSLRNNCIGLTGGVACGKSTIGKTLRSLGFKVVDADVLSRIVVQSGSKALRKIVDQFGKDILLPDGSLDRRKLRSIVFNDYTKLDLLESIVTPQIHELLIKEATEQLWFYEAAILLKYYKATDFKEVWYATCPSEVQLQRLVSRDNISEELAKQMIGRQTFDTTGSILIDTNKTLSNLENDIKAQLIRVGATSPNSLQI